MAQDGNNEQPPRNPRSEAHRTRPQTHPEGWERDAQGSVDFISDWLKNNPDFNRDPEGFLREAGRRMPKTDEELRNAREEIMERPRRERLGDFDDLNFFDEHGNIQIDLNDPEDKMGPEVTDFLQRLNAKLSDPDFKKHVNILREIQSLHELRGAKLEQIQLGLGRIREAIPPPPDSEEAEDKRFRGFSLQYNDMETIRKEGGIRWLDTQFEILYEISKKTELLDSPQVRAIEAKFNEAIGFMLLEGKWGEEEIIKTQNAYNVTSALIFARASVDRKNLEGIQGSVSRLGTRGLFTALAMDEGRVGAMFNRMVEMGNAVRVSGGGFVTEEEHGHTTVVSERQHMDNKMVNDLRENLIKEQFDLVVLKGIGVYKERYVVLKREAGGNEQEAERLLTREIRRAVNAAYNVYGVTEQQAVEASRGKRIEKMPYTFFSDVKSIFDMFNIEEFLTNKWGSLTHAQMQFLSKIKLDLARHEAVGVGVENMTLEQQEELGTRLFKELFTVPDFFSSGWRIGGMQDQIGRLQRYYLYNEKLAEDIVDDGLSEKLGDDLKPKPENRDFTLLEERERKMCKTIKVKLKRMLDSSASASALKYPPEVIPENASDAERKEIESRNKKKLKPYIQDYLRTKKSEEMFLTQEERSFYLSRMEFIDKDIRTIAEEADKNTGDLALFMQLKAAGTGKKNWEKSTAVWEKIKTYRPDDMIRLVRERKGFIGDFAELDAIDSVFSAHGISGETKINASGKEVTVRAHDVFRRDYLPVLTYIRQQALSGMPPRPVDFTNLSPSQEVTINQALGDGAAERVKKVFTGINGYINSNQIIDRLVHNPEYEDLYARTQRTDDVMLDQLEVVPENMSHEDGTVSEHWNAELASDALVRNYNDLANAQQAGNKLVGFLTTEGKDEYKKLALEFSHFVKEYNGLDGAAKGFRYTYGTYLLTAERDYMKDILGIGNLPFRLPSADIQRIFGPGVEGMSREQLLKELDHVRGHLETNSHENPEKYYKDLMNHLGIDSFKRSRDKFFTIFLYLSLLLALTPVASAVAAGGVSAKN